MIRYLARVAAVTMVAALLVPPALGHPDPPGPPPLLTAVTLKEVKIEVQNRGSSASTIYVGDLPFDGALPADGLDGNAEFSVLTNVVHVNHGWAPIETTNDAVSRSVWQPGSSIWEHEECTQRDPITVSGAVIEVDQDNWTGTALNLLSAGYGFYIGGVPGTIVGLIISQAATMNGNDSWGPFGGTVPADGDLVIPLSSSEGRGEITFTGFTDELITDIGCGGTPSPSPSAAMTPSQRTSGVFGPLQEAYALAGLVTPEGGNPAGTTAGLTSDIRSTMVSIVLGSAEMFAGLTIDGLRNTQGIEVAAEEFLSARQMAQEDPQAALSMFADSYLHALEAELEGGVGEPFVLPFDVTLLPGHFATEPDRQVQIGLSVFGAVGVPDVAVSGAPDGVTVESLYHETENVFELLLDISADVRPGDYLLDVVATQGSEEATAFLRLVIGPSSLRACKGRGVTMTGTPADDEIVGSARPNVIAGLGGNDWISGGGGPDVICGSGGNDRLNGNGASDLISGGGGRDRLFGDGGRDRLLGGSGVDRLEGGEGKDRCVGGKGRDRILVGGDEGCEFYR